VGSLDPIVVPQGPGIELSQFLQQFGARKVRAPHSIELRSRLSTDRRHIELALQDARH